MVKLKLDEIYVADFFREGEGSRGHWQLIMLKDEKPRSRFRISIFPTNTIEGMHDKGKFKIKSISEVVYGAKLNKRHEWEDNVTVNAEIEVASADMDFGLEGVNVDAFGFTDEGVGELPWDTSDDLPMYDLKL